MQSHPMWVRGLKQTRNARIASHYKSHPMWVRGLKLTLDAPSTDLQQSHPMWVRGLKHNTNIYKVTLHKVAPYVGAWIETLSTLCS